MTYLVAGAGVEPALLAYERLIHFVLPAQLSGAMVLSPIDCALYWLHSGLTPSPDRFATSLGSSP